jgi:uncharacterized protein YggE
MMSHYSLLRHSSESWNPAREAPLKKFLFKKGWIPACAGITLLGVLLNFSPAQAQEMRAVRTVTVTGQAERRMVPDEAHVYVNVNAQQAKLAAAKTEHDKKLKNLLALAKDLGIEDKYLRTDNSSVQPEYDYNSGKRILRGYVVSSRLDMTVKKTDSVGVLLEKLAAGGFDDTNLSYNFSDAKKISDELLAEAIRNARAKADRMAAAAGTSVGRVFSLNENGVSMPRPPMPMMRMQAMAVADTAAVAPPTGEEAITANVTVSYELKD